MQLSLIYSEVSFIEKLPFNREPIMKIWSIY